jgi:lysozyme family protein
VARAHGFLGNMRSLPESDGPRIYREQYWTRPGFADVAKRMPQLAAELFDTGVNMGPKRAATFLQRSLNALNNHARDYPDIGADGDIGPMTLLALDKLMVRRGTDAELVLLRATDALQGEKYIAIAEANPDQEAFVFGWLKNRVGVSC